MPEVFISYSRKNLPFVEQLVSALEAEGKVVWWDQKKEPLEGIVVGSPWWEQIKAGIETADNFLFVISPDSVVSPYCHAEINHACFHGKRLVTIVYCDWISERDTWEAIDNAIDAIPVEAELPDEVARNAVNFRSLVRQNWLSLNEIQHAIFTSSISFDDPFSQLVKALDLDLIWVKLHSRVRQAAHLWDENGRPENLLWSHSQLKPVYEMIERRKPDLEPLVQEFIKPEQEHLLRRIDDPNTSHQRRSAISERLSVIGDPRAGVGLRADGLPDIVWCQVPEGRITLWPSGRFRATPKELERLATTFDVTPFYIAKYPITYRQFQVFLDDPDGFANPDWWRGLALRQQEIGEQRYNCDNHPRDGVSWFHAVAFCKWLNAKLPRSAWPEKARKGWTIRLPAEWEWHQAATGGLKDCMYPWEGEWDSRRCNTSDSGLGRTTAVGMYPLGAAPVGAMDMAGNVSEWCLNEYNHPKNVGLGGEERRVLRGGSWSGFPALAYCHVRDCSSPAHRYFYFGFRVCCGGPIRSGI